MEEPAENRRTDVNAKKAFCTDIGRQGFEGARVVASPVDVMALNDGHTWYFEVKYTTKQEVYFGAATLTEWMAAVADPSHFRFVVAYQSKEHWRFDEYTPDEFMAYSSIPPFKVYFSLPVGRHPTKGLSRSESRRVHLTEERLRLMGETYEAMRRST